MSNSREQDFSISKEDDIGSSSESSSDESDSNSHDELQLEQKQDNSDLSSTTESLPTTSGPDFKAKKKERMKRLRELHLRRNEARKLNHAEVVEEDKRNKLPANWEARKRKAEWELAEEEAKKQAELAGEDYERVKMLDMSAAELERKDRKQRRKKNPDPGFSDFAQLQHRQYERVTKQMEPDMESYEKQKQKMGAEFYPGVNTLLHGGKGGATESGIDRMVADLEKQIEKRSKYSRKRTASEDADVDYINDKNMKFNKKIARFYDKYTAEIKQNLERGTAV